MPAKGSHHSEETKRKIKESNLGKKRSAETIENMRRARLGKPSWRKGVPLSDETKQKLREARALQVHPSLARRGITIEMVREAESKGLRWCSGQCKAFISDDKFYGESKRQGYCGDCTKQYLGGVREKYSPERKAELAAYMVGYRTENEASVRRVWLLKKYGVTPEWYAQKFIEQDRHCALCDAEVDGRKLSDRCRTQERKYLLVDHDHETGVARGLLCAKCNTALHRVEYIKDWATKALAYLAQYSGGHLGGQETKWKTAESSPENMP